MTTHLYEAMFLLDNQVVREDWGKAKALVTDVLVKHGATVHTARRWDERRLEYPIEKRNRATYLLCYYEVPSEGIAGLRRDFELSERVLRYLLLRAEAVPDTERELAAAEDAEGFVVPAPPDDDAREPEPEESDEDEAPRRRRRDERGDEGEGGSERRERGPERKERAPEKGEGGSDGPAEKKPDAEKKEGEGASEGGADASAETEPKTTTGAGASKED